MKPLRYLTVCVLLLALLLTSCGDVLPGRGSASPADDEEEPGEGPSTGEVDSGDTGDPELPLPEIESAVLINEVCTKNTNTAQNCYDWIELFNSGEESVDLGGWRLSDDATRTAKYVIPRGTVLDPGAYLVIWAVGSAGIAEAPLDGGLYAPFKLSNDGETLWFSSPDGKIADVLDIPALPKDKTYGRSTDGGEIYATMLGSLGATNANTVYLLSESVLTFSHESGFYDSSFRVAIEAPAGYRILYTLDCTDPATSPTAQEYLGEIPVDDPSGEAFYSADYFGALTNSDVSYMDKCFVLRAVACDGEGNNTATVTKNYFVGKGDRAEVQGIPILMLTTAPDDIYGTRGLFTKYGASLDKYEKRVNCMMLDAEGKYVFDQEIGIRIRGSSTRNSPQKNLNLYARADYDGNSLFPDSLFPDAAFTKSLVLRHDNVTGLHLDQSCLQEAVSDRDIVTQDAFPLLVFVDGEYFGLYNLYERVSEDFIEAHYGVDDKNTWIVKFGSEGDEEALAAYRSMIDLMGRDLSVQSNYELLCRSVDMQSLIDLLCTHLYYDNGDFGFMSGFQQNVSAWRAADPALEDAANPYADGRWRFILFDLDYCLTGVTNYSNAVARNTFTETPKNSKVGPAFMSWDLIASLMRSEDFRTSFALTFMDMANVNFSYEGGMGARMTAAAEARKPYMTPCMHLYNNRSSGGTVRDGEHWLSRLTPKDLNFMRDRYDYIVPYMAEALGLTGKRLTLTVGSSLAGAGRVLLNTTAVPEDGTAWSGQYYTCQTLTLTAVAAEGYEFTGWTVSGGSLVGCTADDATIVLTSDGDVTVTANYRALS